MTIDKLSSWNDDHWVVIRATGDKLNDLIDLVNSQQEAIERLQEHVDHEARHVSEPADDKPEYEYGNSITKVKLDGTVLTVPDTHRTVTLRIPKGMRVGEAIVEIYNDYRVANHQMDMWLDDYLVDMSDTDLQAEIDKIWEA